jgi:hypothetical protein
MAPEAEWEKWSDKFIEIVMEIVNCEGIKCYRKSVGIPLRIGETDLVCAKTIKTLIRGRQEYVKSLKKRNTGGPRPSSIGQICEAVLLSNPVAGSW